MKPLPQERRELQRQVGVSMTESTSEAPRLDERPAESKPEPVVGLLAEILEELRWLRAEVRRLSAGGAP